MINIQKGITLFLNNGDSQIQEVSNLVQFLNNEYNFICINTGVDKFGMSPLIRSINTKPEDISKTIKENSFRLEGVCIHIPQNLKEDYKMVWNQLKEYENLIIFVICPSAFRLDVIPHDMVVFREIFEIKQNPEWESRLSSFGAFLANKDSIGEIPRFLFEDVLTEEEFSLDNFKQTYIRDKKLDIFLDDSEDI